MSTTKVRIGDIVDCVVKDKTKRGMVVYRKGNTDIGVSFSHYHLSLTTKPELTSKQRADYLRNFGVDDLFDRSEVKVVEPLTT